MRPGKELLEKLAHFGPGKKGEVLKELGIFEHDFDELVHDGWVRAEYISGATYYLNLRPAHFAQKRGLTDGIRDAIERANKLLNAWAAKRPKPKRRLVHGSLYIVGIGATQVHDYFNPEQPSFFVQCAMNAEVDYRKETFTDKEVKKIVDLVKQGVNELEAEQEQEMAREGAVMEKD